MLRLLVFIVALAAGLLLMPGHVEAVTLEDFLGGRPLTRERIVNDILQYYQQEDPMGIPVLTIPEPFPVDKNFSIAGMVLMGIEVSGHSTFKLQHINVNVTSLQASVLIRIPRLEIISPYIYAGYVSDTVGDVNCTLLGLEIKLTAKLGSDYESRLQLDDLSVDVDKEDFIPEVTNAPVGLSVVVYAADSFFDTIVSSVLDSRIAGIREKLNARLLEKLPEKRFPLGIHPVDLLLAGVKDDLMHKFDPFVIGNKTVRLPAGATLEASNITVTGLSSIHRTHEVSLQLIDDRLLLVVQMGTQQVSVTTDVEVSLSVLPSIVTEVEFSLDSFSVWFEATQSADVRHPPVLNRIHITLGNFRLLSAGESTLSYILEAAVNGLPNALRNTILTKLEPRLHQIIQRRLNTLDIQDLIEKRLEQMRDRE